MFKKIRIILLTFVIVTLLPLNTTLKAKADVASYQLSIAPIRQAKSNWCWAASCDMAGGWAYPSSTRNQWSVVKHVKGSLLNPYPNVPGSLGNSKKGFEYMTHNTISFHYTSSKYTLGSIRTHIINRSHPLQAGAGYYDSNNVRTGGHMVVITGVNTAGYGEKICYLDPWDATEHWVNYSAFVNGSYNGRRYDQTVYY